MILRRFLPPIALLFSILFFWLLEWLGILPNVGVLIDRISRWVVAIGYPAIGVVAALENLIGFNSYFPGSITLLGVMATTSGRPTDAVLTFVSIFLGQALGLLSSYMLGYLGFGRKVKSERASSYFPDTNLPLLFLLFWHPHTAAPTSYLLGSKQHGAQAALLIVGACFFWSVFWALMMYFGVGKLATEIGWDYIGVTFAVCWIAYEYFFGRKGSDAGSRTGTRSQ